MPGCDVPHSHNGVVDEMGTEERENQTGLSKDHMKLNKNPNANSLDFIKVPYVQRVLITNNSSPRYSRILFVR